LVIAKTVSAGELVTVVNHLNVKESLRRFAPAITIVFVDSKGIICGYVQTKEMPSLAESDALHSQFPATVYFIARVGTLTTSAEVEQKLRSCVEAHQLPAEAPEGHELLVDSTGTTTLVVGNRSDA
jgi:hypothetical protein